MSLKSAFLIFILIIIYGCARDQHPQFQGYVEGENTFLASPFSGLLIGLFINRGDHVTKGQLIYTLDPKPQEINIKQIQGELEQASSILNDLEKPKRLPEISAIEASIAQTNAQIQLAELRVSRFKKLYTKQATDKDSLDAAQANLEQKKQLKQQYESNLALAKLGSREDQIKAQKAQINSLEAKLKQANWELLQKTIFAPTAGVIFDTYFDIGEFVASQQPVASLLSPENIRIEFFVPLKYLAKIHVGQKILFNCDGCAKDNLAVINYISPDAEYIPPLVYSRENDSKLIFRIKAKITNPRLFKPGQPVMVHF